MEYLLGPAHTERSGGAIVRLNDDARKCVVFFGYPKPLKNKPEDIKPHGTGFFVSYDGATYLVTAKHIAEDLTKTPFAVRFNAHAGGYRIHHIDIAEWVPHPDSDVAAMMLDIPWWADCKPFAKYFASAHKMGTKNIGTGDLTYTVGLFNLFHGNQRNLPFVHTGHIGLLPEGERVSIFDTNKQRYVMTDGLLVEGQAISRASGAPVFVRRSIPFNAPEPTGGDGAIRAWVHGSVWLLGVWSASYSGAPSDELVQYKGVKKDDKVPYGVGVVVPATKLIEVLEMPDLKRSRKAAEEAHLRSISPTTDSVPHEEAEANPHHKEDFTALLGAAAKKKPQGGRT